MVLTESSGQIHTLLHMLGFRTCQTLIFVKTPWLSVNTKSEETYEIKTEVVNGTISENITGIKAGENKKITYSPNIVPYLNEPYGSIFRRDESGKFQKVDVQ